MARAYQTTVDLLQQRVRQTGNIAVTQNFATEVLGRCERLVNAHTGRVIATSNFSTTASTHFYSYRSTLTTAIDIISIEESNRPLLKCDTLTDLAAYDPDWFKNVTGTRFEAYCQISRDLMVIYPAKAAGGTNDLSITYTKLVDAYTTYAAAAAKNMSLPDEDVEIALGLAEVVLLSRLRRLSAISPRLQALARSMGVNFEVPK